MVGRLILALVLAVAAPAAADELSISGEITYRERIALPADSILHLRLVDTGRLDAPAIVEAEAAIATPGRVPLTFTLRFDESLIQADRSYAIAAEITSAGALWFSSFSPHPVDPIAGKVPEAIVLTFAGRTDGTDDPAPAAPPVTGDTDNAALLDVVWRAEAINGEAIGPTLEASLSVGSDLRAGGRGGCNSYFAQARLAGEHLQFSAIAATKMACSDPAVTELETQFFSALGATRYWRLTGEELLLLDDTGRELVRFGPSDR
jgi:putative lipoprotein